MEPDKSRPRKFNRDEFIVARSDGDPRRAIQRRMAQHQLEVPGSGMGNSHGEDRSFEFHSHPPQHDRAG